MTETVVKFNPTASPGSMFMSTTVRSEIGRIAPTNILPGTLTTSLFAAGSVTNPILGAAAVKAPNLDTGAVTAPALAAGAVTQPALAAGSVTPAAAGSGIPTCYDVNGNPLTMKLVWLTLGQFAALTPDPATTYFCT